MINSIAIKDFTAFHELSLQCSKGINVFVGANSTGKSHLLKLMYAICAANKPTEAKFSVDPAQFICDKLNGVFKPEDKVGRLCRDGAKKANIQLTVIPDKSIEFAFSGDMDEVVVTDSREYEKYSWVPAFIPPKEMLSIFPGFSSLYLQRELTIDETYFDLCQALETPTLKEKPSKLIDSVLAQISKSIGGEFLLVKQQRFYYKQTDGRMLEAELSAEGFRKLGMLQRLLQNGRIAPGVSGPLFWDEPESNLNPSLMKILISILLKLARGGQQIFLATHDYFVLKWLDLLKEDGDATTFHVLFTDDQGNVALNSTQDYLQIQPNTIDDAFAELIDKDIEQSMGDLGK